MKQLKGSLWRIKEARKCNVPDGDSYPVVACDNCYNFSKACYPVHDHACSELGILKHDFQKRVSRKCPLPKMGFSDCYHCYFFWDNYFSGDLPKCLRTGKILDADNEDGSLPIPSTCTLKNYKKS